MPCSHGTCSLGKGVRQKKGSFKRTDILYRVLAELARGKALLLRQKSLPDCQKAKYFSLWRFILPQRTVRMSLASSSPQA